MATDSRRQFEVPVELELVQTMTLRTALAVD